MSEIVLNYTTNILHGGSSGQAFEIPGYTENSKLEVYLDGIRLSEEDYMISNNQDCILFDSSFTTGYTGTEELPVEIHIITQDESSGDNNNGEDDSSTSIYYPKNYSEMADIPKDMRKMALSIDELKQDKLIAGSNITIEGNVVSATGGGASTDIPTKTSDLTNDSGFITNTVDDLVNYYSKTESYSKEEINNIVNNISTLNIAIVESLPTENISTSTIYLVAKENSEDKNVYDEYIYVSESWEKIGDTKISLVGLATEEYVNSKLGDIDAILTNIADESEAI